MRGLRWIASGVMLAILCGPATAAVAAPASSPRGAEGKKSHKKGHKPAVVHCKPGQARLTVGKRTICVKSSLPVTHLTPQAAMVSTALTLDLGHARDRRGRHAPQLAKLLRRRGPNTQKNLEQTIAAGLAKGQALVLAGALGRHAHAASVPNATAAASCGAASKLEQARKEYEELPPAEKEQAGKEIAEVERSTSFKNGEIEAEVDLGSGAIKLGIDTKAKGVRIDVSLRTCGGEGLEIDSCPTVQGKVEGKDHSEMEATFKVSEGAKLVFSQGLKFKGETTVKAQTGDDGKLDYYDIKHIYSLAGSFGGSKTAFGPMTVETTYIGEAHIDMRSGSQQAPPAVVDVMTTMAGVDPAERIKAEIELAHKSQDQGDKEFSAEVDKVTAKLRSREAGWLKANTCASMHFEPASETLKLKKGQTGTFKSLIEASKGGAPPAATWTLGAQQNATFTPGAAQANPLSTSYNVTNAGKGLLVSATVKATSKAGVAEGTWKQKTESLIQTITGTFSGTDEREGELLKWTGSATFVRIPESPDGASILETTTSEVTVTVAGVAPDGCKVAGEEQVPIFEKSVFSVLGEATPGVGYDIDAPFGFPGRLDVVFSGCPPKGEGDGPGTVSLPGEALLTGDAIHGGPGALVKTSSDGVTFDGSGTASEPEEGLSWSWSFTGTT